MASSLVTQSFEGAPGGMNLAVSPQEIPSTQARYIQDALVDLPGLVRRRGPIQAISGIAQPATPVSGLAVTLDPKGTTRYGVFRTVGGVGQLSTWSDDLQSIVNLPWPFPFPTAPPSSPYLHVSVSPWLSGGTCISASDGFGLAGAQGSALWRGANKANYSTGTITMTQGGTAVTGVGTSWLTTAAPGMFLFAVANDIGTTVYIGYVKSVNSNTSLTLGSPALHAATAKAHTLTSLRGIYARAAAGRITVASGAQIVNGGDTKFRALGLGSGYWDLYRADDLSWIGNVNTVNSDTQLFLAAPAAIGLADENYLAMRSSTATLVDDLAINTIDGQTNPGKLGWLTATYANRQWFANLGRSHDLTYRLWFSDTVDPEAVDWSTDGDWLAIGEHSTAKDGIRGLASTQNSLLVFKDQETYAIFGDDPSNFSVSLIHDDGVIAPMTIQQFEGGVLWAGRRGIYLYDGAKVRNISAPAFGTAWEHALKGFDSSKYRAWSMLMRDHYVLFIESVAPDVVPVKGNTSAATTSWTAVANLQSGAFTLFTNLNLRGSALLPSTGGMKGYYVVNGASAGNLCLADDLFDATGVDAIAADGGTAGPDFYFESKKFNVGDPLLLKRFKVLLLNYLVAGGNIKVDVVTGLNDIGQTLVSNFPSTTMTWDTLRTSFLNWTALKTQYGNWGMILGSVFLPKRVKFQKKTQHFAFRLYQSTSAITSLKIGPYQIGFKFQRPGRV